MSVFEECQYFRDAIKSVDSKCVNTLSDSLSWKGLMLLLSNMLLMKCDESSSGVKNKNRDIKKEVQTLTPPYTWAIKDDSQIVYFGKLNVEQSPPNFNAGKA